MDEARVIDEPGQADDYAMVALVLGLLAALVVVFGYLWQAQSTGGIQWGRQIWVILAFVVLALPGLGLGITSVIQSHRKILAATGLTLTGASGVALYLLMF